MTQIKIFSNTFVEVEKQVNEWLNNNNDKISIRSITQSQGGHNALNVVLTITYETVDNKPPHKENWNPDGDPNDEDRFRGW